MEESWAQVVEILEMICKCIATFWKTLRANLHDLYSNIYSYSVQQPPWYRNAKLILSCVGTFHLLHSKRKSTEEYAITGQVKT